MNKLRKIDTAQIQGMVKVRNILYNAVKVISSEIMQQESVAEYAKLIKKQVDQLESK